MPNKAGAVFCSSMMRKLRLPHLPAALGVVNKRHPLPWEGARDRGSAWMPLKALAFSKGLDFCCTYTFTPPTPSHSATCENDSAINTRHKTTKKTMGKRQGCVGSIEQMDRKNWLRQTWESKISLWKPRSYLIFTTEPQESWDTGRLGPCESEGPG